MIGAGENCTRSFKLVFLAIYNYNDQAREDEIGRTCSKNSSVEECI
jgi:hypothetical protein